MHESWVVARQDADGDRFFVDREGYWTPDFFLAVKYTDLSEATQRAEGKGVVMPAREAWQLTVTFDQRSHGVLV